MSDGTYDHLMDGQPSYMQKLGIADGIPKTTPLGWTIVGTSVAAVIASVYAITRKGGFLSDGNTKRIAARRKRNGFYQKDGAVYWRGMYADLYRDWMIIRADGKAANNKAITKKLIATYRETNQ
jgi:hypothetical protein